jgi:hypothetical protein
MVRKDHPFPRTTTLLTDIGCRGLWGVVNSSQSSASTSSTICRFLLVTGIEKRLQANEYRKSESSKEIFASYTLQMVVKTAEQDLVVCEDVNCVQA